MRRRMNQASPINLPFILFLVLLFRLGKLLSIDTNLRNRQGMRLPSAAPTEASTHLFVDESIDVNLVQLSKSLVAPVDRGIMCVAVL